MFTMLPQKVIVKYEFKILLMDSIKQLEAATEALEIHLSQVTPDTNKTRALVDAVTSAELEVMSRTYMFQLINNYRCN